LRINAGPDRDAAKIKIIRPGCAGNEKSSSRTATGNRETADETPVRRAAAGTRKRNATAPG